MERHDYHEEMKADIIEYLKEEYTAEEIKRRLEDKDEFYEELYDALWVTDSVTGNASGSYTFNTWQAEENLCHNLGLLRDALAEFCAPTMEEAIDRGAEFCDVTIRCYMLGSVLYQVLNELEWGC